MTHCSLVSLVRLVQVHLALVPLKPSSGPLYPPFPLPLSLCPAKFHFNIATATKGYDQISPRGLVTIYARQRTLLQTTLQNQNLQRLQLLYFLFPSLCVLPSQSWTIIICWAIFKVLLTLCVVALGPVVAGPALPKDKVVRTEDLVS